MKRYISSDVDINGHYELSDSQVAYLCKIIPIVFDLSDRYEARDVANFIHTLGALGIVDIESLNLLHTELELD